MLSPFIPAVPATPLYDTNKAANVPFLLFTHPKPKNTPLKPIQ